MADRYISRDMAIARLTKVEVTNGQATMTDAKREIAEMPAADVVPVRHGRLIEDETTCPGAGLANYKCTVCGRINGAWWQGLPAEWLPGYCWNCGAKMDGGEEG